MVPYSPKEGQPLACLALTSIRVILLLLFRRRAMPSLRSYRDTSLVPLQTTITVSLDALQVELLPAFHPQLCMTLAS
jgi:hypothetical protein